MRKTIHDNRSAGGGHHPPGTTKKLTLHRETLRELTAPDLHRIVGGAVVTSGRQVCISDDPSG